MNQLAAPLTVSDAGVLGSEENLRASSRRTVVFAGVRVLRLRSERDGPCAGILTVAGPRKMAFSTLALTRRRMASRTKRPLHPPLLPVRWGLIIKSDVTRSCIDFACQHTQNSDLISDLMSDGWLGKVERRRSSWCKVLLREY